MLRWVRGLYPVMIAFGLLLTLLTWASGMGMWWLGLVVAGLGVSGYATIGSSIRRAEAHGPNDPATRPERMRRAERLTLACAAGVTAVVVIVSLLADGPGLALALGLMLSLGAVLGIWVFRRWVR
jgi:hypothetical protein